MDKELNKLLNKEEQENSLEILESHPISVILPTGSRCNFQCVFCTDRVNTESSSYMDLSFESFLNFIEPLNSASSVGLYGWGEPFLNPHYQRIFEYVKNNFYGIQIHISTNGLLLTDNWRKLLSSYPYSVINVSLNASTRKTHHLLTRNNHFDEIINNIRLLITLRRTMRTNFLYVSLSFILLKQNFSELPSFIKLTSELGVDFVLILDLIILEKSHNQFSINGMQDQLNDVILTAKEISHEKDIQVISFSNTSYFHSNNRNLCFDPWESFKVSMNGDVSICCYSNVIAGNLLKQNVNDIWNGDVYRYYRRAVNTNNAPPECLICPRKKGGNNSWKI